MDLSSIKALILAGGLGTRLRTVVADRPKGMAEVADKPFLEYSLAWLQREGIRRVVLCVGHQAEHIINYFDNGARWGLHLEYSVETQRLGTGGALRLARSLVTETFIAMNGDTFYTDTLAPLIAAHHQTNAQFTIALSHGGSQQASGQIALSKTGQVQKFAEKTEDVVGEWLNAGLYVIEPEFLDAVPPETNLSLERRILPQHLAQGAKIYGYPLQHGFIDMGTAAGLQQLKQYLEKNHRE